MEVPNHAGAKPLVRGPAQRILDAPVKMDSMIRTEKKDEGSIWIQKMEDNLVRFQRNVFSWL